MHASAPLVICAALSLAACGTRFVQPVVGEIGNVVARGEADVGINGAGSFYVISETGLRCDGTYDSLLRAPTITAPVTCSDGRTGELEISRQIDGASGTATGTLSDGTVGRFVFGALPFRSAFGEEPG